jgi:hypothetical protein
MNKKGSTLTNWIFIVLSVTLFLVIFQSQLLDPMNRLYNQSLSVGLDSDAQQTISSIESTTKSSSSEIKDAEVSKLSDGLTLIQIGSVAKRTFDTLLSFISGRFLTELLVNQLGFPKEVAVVVTILIWISLIFAVVRIFTRGVTA